ncbi:MAG TPA: MmcQ/YjbR family DNA-binding protein [Gemmatimonadaceae bacterium]
MSGAGALIYDDVRAIALALPGVEEGTSYGTAALKVKGKLFVRLKEDGETIVLRTDEFERSHLMQSHPKIFYITDHYRDYPWVLVRLTAVRRPMLKELVHGAWQRVAPKTLRES